MNLIGLSEARRGAQVAANRGKLVHNNRLERGRSFRMGKAMNTGYCGQKHLGFSLSDERAKELFSGRAYRLSIHLPTSNILCVPK